MKAKRHIPARLAAAALLLVLGGQAGAAVPAQEAAAAPVTVEVISVGIDGYVDYYSPGTILYRISNPGPARKVHLKLLRIWKKGGGENVAQPDTFDSTGQCVQYIDLKANETSEGTWIVPELRPSYGPAELFLVVRGDDERILGKAVLPAIKQMNPVVILTLDPQSARPIQDAILWKSEGGIMPAMRPEIAFVTDHPPRLWYEYGPARLVVLARPWGGLGVDEKKALGRWVAFGGTLVVIPQACPDWKRLSGGAALEESAGANAMGEGRIYIAQAGKDTAHGGAIDEKALREWLNSSGLSMWDYGMSPAYKSLGTPPLLIGYLMPGTWMLALFVLFIIILVGPVTHLVLARVRRREWAWILIPALSVVLALGTYALSAGVKGEGTAMEVHHILRISPGAEDCSVSTAVRIMSSEKKRASVRFAADNPVTTQTFSLFDTFGSPVEKSVAIHPGLFRISGLLLQKYGIRDLSFLSAASPLPLGVQMSGEGAKIENTSGMDLRDVFLNVGGFWTPVASRLKSGEAVKVPRPREGVPLENLKPPWETAEEWEATKKTLYAAIPSFPPLAPAPSCVVARCSPRGLPKVAMEPVPDKVSETVTCAWKVPDHWVEQGGSP